MLLRKGPELLSGISICRAVRVVLKRGLDEQPHLHAISAVPVLISRYCSYGTRRAKNAFGPSREATTAAQLPLYSSTISPSESLTHLLRPPSNRRRRRSTFLGLDRWLAEARAMASTHLVVVLVGNKVDREAAREVDYLEGLRWAETNSESEEGQAIHCGQPVIPLADCARTDVLFLETSSLTGHNASQPFLLLAQSILHLLDTATIDPDAPGTGVSFGERQLRAVASSSRLSFPGVRRRRESVSLADLVGREGRCCGSG